MIIIIVIVIIIIIIAIITIIIITEYFHQITHRERWCHGGSCDNSTLTVAEKYVCHNHYHTDTLKQSHTGDSILASWHSGTDTATV